VEERLKILVADILDVDPESIDGSTTRDNTESWDSLNHINLVTALEQQFGVSFDVSEIESMSSFDDILQLMEVKLAS
jgi:acyl carrier protein